MQGAQHLQQQMPRAIQGVYHTTYAQLQHVQVQVLYKVKWAITYFYNLALQHF